MNQSAVQVRSASGISERSYTQSESEITIEYLFKNYASALYLVINRIVKSHETAEDLLQEVFVKIWQNLYKYSPKQGSLYSWMAVISRNYAISYLRSSCSKNLPRFVDDTSIITISNKTYVSTIGINAIGVPELLKALPCDQRELIHTFYFSGFTQVEIAESFEMPLGTVKTKLRGAVNNLRKIISPEVTS